MVTAMKHGSRDVQYIRCKKCGAVLRFHYMDEQRILNDQIDVKYIICVDCGSVVITTKGGSRYSYDDYGDVDESDKEKKK